MGKRTTTRHKEENTFRFQGQKEKERLLKVNHLGAIRNWLLEEGDGNDEASFLYKAMVHWQDMNQYQEFQDVLNDIGEDIKTLHQVLHRKDHIKTVLLSKITVASKGYLDALFGLINAFVSDIRQEFGDYLPATIRKLTDVVINTSDTEIVSPCVDCYSRLMKELKVVVVKDFGVYLKIFARAMHSKAKPFVKKCVVKAFAFVASKVCKTNQQIFSKKILRVLSSNTGAEDGFAQLLCVLLTSDLVVPKCLNVKDLVGFQEFENTEKSVWENLLIKFFTQLVRETPKNLTSKVSFELIWDAVTTCLLLNTDRDRLEFFLRVMVILINRDVNGNTSGELVKVKNFLCQCTIWIGENREFWQEKQGSKLLLVEIVHGMSSDRSLWDVAKSLLSYVIPVLDIKSLQHIDDLFLKHDLYPEIFVLLTKEYEQRSEQEYYYWLSNVVLANDMQILAPPEQSQYKLGFKPASLPCYYFRRNKRKTKAYISQDLFASDTMKINSLNQITILATSDWSSEQAEKCARSLLLLSQMRDLPEDAVSRINCLIQRVFEDLRNSSMTEDRFFVLYLVFENYFLNSEWEGQVHMPILSEFLALCRNFCATSDEQPCSFSIWCLKCLDIVTLYLSTQADDETKRKAFAEAGINPSELMSGFNRNLSSGFKTIRVLSLSIMYFLCQIDISQRNRMQFVQFLELALENELKEFNVTEMNHVENYLKMEKCIRDSEYSENADSVSLHTMLWYTTSVLFNNNATIMQKGRDFLLPVLADKLGAETFWILMHPHFTCINSSSFVPRETYVEPAETEFLQRLRLTFFGMRGYAQKLLGTEIKIDFIRYNSNLWKVIECVASAVPGDSQKEILSNVYELFRQVVSPPPFTGLRQDAASKDKLMVLEAALALMLIYCKNNVHNHQQCKEMALILLQGPKNIQNLATRILRKMSRCIDNFLLKVENVGELNWYKSAHLKSYDGDDAFFRPDDETIFIDFVVRTLMATKYDETTTSHIASFLQKFSEDQALRIVKMLVGTKEAWQDLEWTPGSLKYVKGLMKTIHKLISEWRFVYPSVVEFLIHRVCDLTKAVSSMRSSSLALGNPELEELLSKRVKSLVTIGRSCIVLFFDLFSNQFIAGDLIDCIFRRFIWDTDTFNETMTNYSTDSINWLLKLMMVWSKCPRYHPLFVKCDGQRIETTAGTRLFDVLESSHLKSKPRTFAIQIVNNLASELNDELSEVENATSVPLELGEVMNTMDTGVHAGVTVLNLFKNRLFKVITQDEFVLDKVFLQNPDEHINFLRTCVKLSGDAGVTQKLCRNIIGLASKFRNRVSELVDIYKLVKEMLEVTSPNAETAGALTQCLVWTVGKSPREALCDALSVAMVNKNHARLITDLNSYLPSLGDAPDFERRQKAFDKCISLTNNLEKYKSILIKALSYTCFFYCSNELDIGLLSASEALLESLALKLSTLYEVEDNQKPIRGLIDKVIIPQLKGAFKSKIEEIFNAHVKGLSIFARHCKTIHGTFQGVNLIFQSTGEKDILLDFIDLQLSSKARAANHFKNVIHEMKKHPVVVMDFVLPLLSHHLLDVGKLKAAMTNVIQCCLEGIRCAILSLPHGMYFRYFENLLTMLPEQEILHKQYHKLIGVVLDAYHYVLDPNFVRELSHGPAQELPRSTDCPSEATLTEDTSEIEFSSDLEVQLNFAESKSLMSTIEKKFIPKLRKYLHLEEKSTHKLAKTQIGDSDLVKKIPTTLSYVKLLRKLPSQMRRSHMVWVIPTLCSSLNSKLFSIRANVRTTLVEVVKELGAFTFREVVKHVKAYLTRGFQKHVRNFTLVYILKQLQSLFEETPQSVPYFDILPIIEDELFGTMSEDKDVKQILSKTPEAKGQNALQLLHFCAIYCDREGLEKLVECPLERAKTITSFSSLKIVKSWMTEVANGLAASKSMETMDLLQFIKSLEEKYVLQSSISESRDELSKYLAPVIDSRLLPCIKKHQQQKARISVPVVTAWFVYSLLYNLLKKDCFPVSNQSCDILNQFALRIANNASDQLLEVRTPTVRSLILMFQFPLECFNNQQFLTEIWRKYFLAVNDAVSNEDVNMYYKFLTTFCVTFPDFRMDLTDFNLLIKCILRHLQENKCTGSALVLLRNILQRSLTSEDLMSLVREVKRRICADDSVHVQEGCRLAYAVYMKNYLKDKSDFMAELYHFFKVAGFRKSLQDVHSAYYMISHLITMMPESWISTTIVNLAADLMLALMKSSDPETQRILCNSCLKNALDRMGLTEATVYINEIEVILQNKDMLPFHREICLTISKIVEHKHCWNSEALILKIVAFISSVLKPISYSDLAQKNPNLKIRHREFGIYEAILATHQCLTRFGGSTKTESQLGMLLRQILDWIRTEYLVHEHDSIQHASVVCINTTLLFQQPFRYFFPDTSKINAKELLLDLIKKYFILGGVLELVEMRRDLRAGLKSLAEISGEYEDDDFHSEISKLLRSHINLEIRKAPKETKKREMCFAFLEIYSRTLPANCLLVVQQSAMVLTTRERTDENMTELSQDIVDMCANIQKVFESRLGQSTFLELYQNARAILQGKRENARAIKKERRVHERLHSGPGSIHRKRPKSKQIRTDGPASKLRKQK